MHALYQVCSCLTKPFPSFIEMKANLHLNIQKLTHRDTHAHGRTRAFIDTRGYYYARIRAQLLYAHTHTFIPTISIAPLQVFYYSEALPTAARILYRSFTPKRTGNCR